jgi:hypothetical protein
VPQRQCKAAINVEGDDAVFLVAETPGEATELVERAYHDERMFVEFTSGNHGPWNGKPIFIRTDLIRAITPPVMQDD